MKLHSQLSLINIKSFNVMKFPIRKFEYTQFTSEKLQK